MGPGQRLERERKFGPYCLPTHILSRVSHNGPGEEYAHLIFICIPSIFPARTTQPATPSQAR